MATKEQTAPKPTLTADKNAAMKLPASMFKLDPEELQPLAQKLIDAAGELTEPHTLLTNTLMTSESVVSDYTGEWEPTGTYQGTREAWEKAGKGHKDAVGKLITKLTNLANGIQWLIEHADQTERENARKAAGVDTNIGGTGTGGNKPAAPVPAAPAPATSEPTQYT